MQNEIYDEKNGLTYMLCGDYYLPELALTDIEPTYGKYGMLLEIVEVMDYNGEEIDTRILYQFEETGREHGRIAGKWKKVQDLANTEKLFSAGYQTL